jgi:hypothetical protein
MTCMCTLQTLLVEGVKSDMLSGLLCMSFINDHIAKEQPARCKSSVGLGDCISYQRNKPTAATSIRP